MSYRPVRFLVVALSPLLAAPAGWCCVLEAHLLGPAVASKARTCGGLCCKLAAKVGKSAPAPTPPRHSRCPCDDRNSTSPDSTAGKSGHALHLPAVCNADVPPTLTVPSS